MIRVKDCCWRISDYSIYGYTTQLYRRGMHHVEWVRAACARLGGKGVVVVEALTY